MKAFFKNGIKELIHAIPRLLSIITIVALGVGIFIGVKTGATSMKNTAEIYYTSQKLMDMHVFSTYGFTKDDIKALGASAGVTKAEGSYSVDLILENIPDKPVVKAMSLPKEEANLNEIMLYEGRMPNSPEECVMEIPKDNHLVDSSQYSIGKKLVFSEDVGGDPLSDKINRREFTIVGFVRSPLYISIEKGATSLGNGTLSLFLYLKPEVFSFERYTEAYLKTDAEAMGIKNEDTAFKDRVSEVKNDVELVGKQRLKINYDKIMDEGHTKINDAKKEYEDGRDTFNREITQGEQKLADGERDYREGVDKYKQGVIDFETQMKEGEQKLIDAKAQLEQGKRDLEEGKRKYQEGLAEYEKGKEEYDAAKPEAEAKIAEGEQKLLGLKNLIEALNGNIALAEAALEPGGVPLNIPVWVGSMNAILSNLPEEFTEIKTSMQALVQNVALNGPTQENVGGLKAVMAGLESGYKTASDELESAKAKLADGEQKLIDAKTQLDKSKQEIIESEEKLVKGEEELNQGYKDLEDGRREGEEKLSEAWEQLRDARIKLDEGYLTLEKEKAEGQEKLDEAALKIADGEKELADVEFGKWVILKREDSPGYASYWEDANRIDNLSNIFPLFLLLVAALVTTTTMSRMVENHRSEMGTFKALGYRDQDILSRYVGFGFFSSAIGGLLGVGLGVVTLPYLIAGAYSNLYAMPKTILDIPWNYVFISIVVVIFSTVGASLIIGYMELKETPSVLLRPKAPKAGKRILLERIDFIWKRFSFIWKVTIRNIFRYKARFLMTIIGIAGCTALILAGFGLQNSIFSIVPRQFNDVMKYDGMMVFKNSDTSKNKSNILGQIKKDTNIKEALLVHQQSVSVKTENNAKSLNAYIVVPEDKDVFENLYDLHNRKTPEVKIPISDTGAVITEQIANIYKLKVGDTFNFTIDKETYSVPVAAVCENYLANYIYLTPALYQKTISKPVAYNLTVFSLNDRGKSATNTLSEHWLTKEEIINVVYMQDEVETANNSLLSLNVVVVVMLLSAAALAFVVLYNLTGINIEERIREIATIRVLGFYNSEVYTYVFRENIVLSLMGMCLGIGLGKLLNSFMLNTLETDVVMFNHTIFPQSYLYACVLTMLFTMIVCVMMIPMIKRIDMVESLKSIE